MLVRNTIFHTQIASKLSAYLRTNWLLVFVALLFGIAVDNYSGIRNLIYYGYDYSDVGSVFSIIFFVSGSAVSFLLTFSLISRFLKKTGFQESEKSLMRRFFMALGMALGIAVNFIVVSMTETSRELLKSGFSNQLLVFETGKIYQTTNGLIIKIILAFYLIFLINGWYRRKTIRFQELKKVDLVFFLLFPLLMTFMILVAYLFGLAVGYLLLFLFAIFGLFFGGGDW